MFKNNKIFKNDLNAFYNTKQFWVKEAFLKFFIKNIFNKETNKQATLKNKRHKTIINEHTLFRYTILFKVWLQNRLLTAGL